MREKMDALLVINERPEDREFNKRVLNIVDQMSVVAVFNFEEAVQEISRKEYKLVVFMTYADAFPDDWKINELEIGSPVFILQRVNKLDMLLINSFFNSLGMLSKPRSAEDSQPATNPLFYESLLFIEENLHENDLSLNKVASHMYVSRCHYSRMFKSQLGTGFKEYIVNKRIQKAQLLLQEGRSVTEVCYTVGYNDLTHFARVFKKLIGVNPSVYRQQNVLKAAGGHHS